MQLENIDVTFSSNVMPVIGLGYLIYSAVKILTAYFISGENSFKNQSGKDLIYGTIVKMAIVSSGCLAVFASLQKKTWENYFYLFGFLFTALYIFGELFIEVCLHVIIPIFSDSEVFKKLMRFFFYEEPFNRTTMKNAMVILSYSIVMLWVVNRIMI